MSVPEIRTRDPALIRSRRRRRATLEGIGILVAALAGSVAVAAWWASRETARYRASAHAALGPAASEIDFSALPSSIDGKELEILPDPAARTVEVRVTAQNPDAAMHGALAAAEAVRDASVGEAPDSGAVDPDALIAELGAIDSAAGVAAYDLVQIRERGARGRLVVERRSWEELLAGIAAARSAGSTATPRGAAARRAPDSSIEGLRAQWAAQRMERSELLTGASPLPPTHPDVQRLSTLIAASEDALERAVRGRIAFLSAGIAQLPDATGAGAVAAADSVRLLGEIESLATRAAALQVEIMASEGTEGVAEPPSVEPGATERLPGDPRAELLTGAIAGLLLGIAGGGLRLRAAARPPAVPGPHAASAESAVAARTAADDPPLLAVIPKVSPTLVEPLPNGDFRPGPGQTAGLAAYLELRNRLLRSHWGLKALVVTSAHPGEGKTTTSTNLAATYARQGLKVVLIECDLRRPSLGRYFGITKQLDLMDVLFEGRDWRLALQLTRTPGLFVLLGEKSFPRAGDSLGGPEMRRLLTEITAEYDLVMLDSSPLLVAEDAIALAPIVDGVLLVARATRTDPATLAREADRLRRAGATVVGAVLNDPDGVAYEWLSSASPDPGAARRGSGTPVPPSPES